MFTFRRSFGELRVHHSGDVLRDSSFYFRASFFRFSRVNIESLSP